MKKEHIILVFFILAKFLLQYRLISPAYELHRDEFLHLDLGKHPDWGYLSVPPVTGLISRVIYLLGNSEFWVKFFPALSGALTIWVVWKAIDALKGDLYAKVLGATCLLFSVLLRLNTLYQPNSIDVLCWTTVYYCIIRYINGENGKWLMATAVVFALGFLNKYNIIFLLIGMLPALLVTDRRKIFGQPVLYIAALIALAIVMPNLIWQYRNGFPVVTHMKALSDLQLVNVSRSGFLFNQVLFFYSSFFVLIASLIALIGHKPFGRYRVFLWSLLFTLLVFIYLKAKDYYAIGIYPIYFAFGSVYLSRILKFKRGVYLKGLSLVLPVVLFIPMYRYAFPDRSPEYIIRHKEAYSKLGLLRWEDGRDHELPQDFADMLGWKELAAEVDKAYAAITDGHTLILCDNYGQAGAINYYSKLGLRAVSFNGDYINWFELEEPYTNLIRVKEGKEREDEMEKTRPYFERATESGRITNPYARESGATVFSFVGAKTDINERIRSEIAEKKK